MRDDLYATLRERIVKVVPDLLDATSQNIKILGRDIQLADVLRAIDSQRCGGCRDGRPWGEGAGYSECEGCGDDPFSMCEKGYEGFREIGDFVTEDWNLALPLHEQSDDLGEWLLTVLTPSA